MLKPGLKKLVLLQQNNHQVSCYELRRKPGYNELSTVGGGLKLAQQVMQDMGNFKGFERSVGFTSELIFPFLS